MTKELATQQQAAVSSVLDKPVENREAWRLLQAEYGNQGIEPDKWRLLALAFAKVPDDILNQAVIKHMAESPYFPRLSDLQKQIQALRPPPTPFETFRGQMLKLGYHLVSDEGGTAVFSNNIQKATVRH